MTKLELNKDNVNVIKQVIAEHKLPKDFISTVNNYYLPLADDLISKAKKPQQGNCLFLGIQGTQGSGKSTCAAFLKLIFETHYNKRTLVISIDDFYLTLKERQSLAKTSHPLFITRGAPGTHDIPLLEKTVSQCSNIKTSDSISIPIFDKSIDDRATQAQWQTVNEPLDIIILEGWCVGLTEQSESELKEPINELEVLEDRDQSWRNYVNQKLANEYAELYAKFDYLIALQAPSFECVFEWRLLQEQKLAEKLKQNKEQSSSPSKVQTKEQLRRFISHYERLTRHALTSMPTQADYLLLLEADHQFSKLIITKN